MMKIPFFDLSEQNRSLEKAVLAAFKCHVRASDFILGEEVKRFEEEFALFCGSRYAVGVNSGLDALILALRGLGLGAGDEVIVPANSFIATALAVSAVGATPVFADVDPVRLLLDPVSVQKVLTPKTKALIPVHLYGHPAAMKELDAICKKHKLFMVEDACQAHGAKIGAKSCGSLGDVGCFSFYPSKNLGAYGDGGMITTDNKELYEKLLLLRNYGSVVKYIHLEAGLNTRLDAVQAGVLRIKLPRLNKWNQKRRVLAAAYQRHLKNISQIALPQDEVGVTPIYHLYVIRTDRRAELQAFLKEEGVGTAIHYPIPIHFQKPYEAFRNLCRLPVCEKEADRLLSLPMYPEMTLKQVDLVCRAIRKFFEK